MRPPVQAAAAAVSPAPQLRADQSDGNQRDGDDDAHHERTDGEGRQGCKQRKAAQGDEKARKPALGPPRVGAALFPGQGDLDVLFHTRNIMAPLR